ncbi:amidohydrolase [Ureibacillus sp. 179-F W5.1 NHS]|uniref:Amidohydrolase n=1 Tax=Lysinibacillus halotolerans TaxID=1368476 RepID=A0A3M8HDE6_9BACI|nr:amidohydrolase [Lysinibacillus halotolerans]RND00350.1 amidohydrolase [Lysinibacillus halotolerans]
MKKLWYGGTIYTMEREGETVEAVLVEDDKIVAVGTMDELKNQADEQIDLQGAAMYPGFVDSHLHILFQGEKLLRLDLSKATSAEEMLELVKAAAQTTPPDKWLFGEGWNENNFVDKRIPTIEELDEIRKEPILLTRVCHHVALGNTAALRAGGIDQTTPSPSGGEIGRDENGNLNGLLYDQATNLVSNAIPKEGDSYIQYLVDALNLSIDDMLSKGLTGGHSEDMSYFGKFTNPLTAYEKVVGEKHHFRVNLLRHHAVFEEMMESNVQFDDPFIEPGAMKIFVDGALGGSTAALIEPYADNPNNKGLFIHTDDQLESLVKLARKYNEAIAVHIIGDAAAQQVLNVIEKYPAPKGKRDRLIHCCILNEQLIHRMTKLPVILDLQPAFVPSDFPWAIDRLGGERLKYAYAWKTLMNRGLMCAAGTDAPVEDIDPIATIYAAVERKKPTDDHDGYLPHEKLTRFEAIRAYTVGSAQAIGKEEVRGLIKAGFDADFSIFDRDLLKGTSEEMLKAKAVQTVVAGRIVFKLPL